MPILAKDAIPDKWYRVHLNRHAKFVSIDNLVAGYPCRFDFYTPIGSNLKTRVVDRYSLDHEIEELTDLEILIYDL